MKKSFIKKIGEIFYKRKYRDGFFVYRILFFRFKKPCEEVLNQDPQKAELYIPQVDNIGKCSYGNPDIFIVNPQTKIGAFCSFGPRVVLGHGKHPINFLSTSPYFYFERLGYKDKNQVGHEEYWDLEPIEIGNDVWIGDGVFVKNGIKIGDGAIIGARAVVTKDVPPYAIVVGSPAKIIKYRFDEETIKTLLELKWWELDDEIIKQIPYDDINKAIEFIKEVRNN